MTSKSKPKLRAVVSSRISVLTDVTTSPESQKKRGDAEAVRRGFTVVGYADDLDVSASKINPWDRPELGWWLRHPEKFDVLIFRDIYRLARRMLDFARFLDWADEHDIQLVSLDPDIDYRSDFGRMMAYQIAMFADMESRQVTSRLKGANEFMRSIARWGHGRVPYGYRTCPHPSGTGYALEVDPDTGAVLLWMIDKYLGDGVKPGESLLSIARELNERGEPSPEQRLRKAGKPRKGKRDKPVWHARTIDLIFRSPSMRNVVHHQGRIVRDEDGNPLRYGDGVLTAEEHRRLLAEMGRRGASKPRSPNSGTAPLLGILVCATCGYNLYRNVAKSGKDTVSRTYRCGSRHRGLSDCPGSSVHEKEAQDYIYGRFLRDVGNLQVVEYIEDPGEDHSAEIAELEEALAELESDRYDGGLYRGEEGRRRFRKRADRYESELERLRALPSRPPSVVEKPLDITYATEWDMAGPDEKRAILLRFGITGYVTGKCSDGVPESERIEYESLGASVDQITEQGHDEIEPDW